MIVNHYRVYNDTIVIRREIVQLDFLSIDELNKTILFCWKLSYNCFSRIFTRVIYVGYFIIIFTGQDISICYTLQKFSRSVEDRKTLKIS